MVSLRNCSVITFLVITMVGCDSGQTVSNTDQISAAATNTPGSSTTISNPGSSVSDSFTSLIREPGAISEVIDHSSRSYISSLYSGARHPSTLNENAVSNTLRSVVYGLENSVITEPSIVASTISQQIGTFNDHWVGANSALFTSYQTDALTELCSSGGKVDFYETNEPNSRKLAIVADFDACRTGNLTQYGRVVLIPGQVAGDRMISYFLHYDEYHYAVGSKLVRLVGYAYYFDRHVCRGAVNFNLLIEDVLDQKQVMAEDFEIIFEDIPDCSEPLNFPEWIEGKLYTSEHGYLNIWTLHPLDQSPGKMTITDAYPVIPDVAGTIFISSEVDNNNAIISYSRNANHLVEGVSEPVYSTIDYSNVFDSKIGVFPVTERDIRHGGLVDFGDSDGDRLPDSVEKISMLDSDNPNDADIDSDNDGYSNLLELQNLSLHNSVDTGEFISDVTVQVSSHPGEWDSVVVQGTVISKIENNFPQTVIVTYTVSQPIRWQNSLFNTDYTKCRRPSGLYIVECAFSPKLAEDGSLSYETANLIIAGGPTTIGSPIPEGLILTAEARKQVFEINANNNSHTILIGTDGYSSE